MEFIKILRQRHLALLWLSQVTSAIGDQIYLVAAIWLAVQISPGAAALVAAAEFGSMLVFGLIGGVFADRLNRMTAMLVVDILRAATVMTLPIAAHFGSVSIAQLVIVGAILGGLGALFNPCLLGSLRSLTESTESLHAMNALIDLTRRLAAIIGPGLAGWLAATLPTAQLFTLNAISFLASAAALYFLSGKYDWTPQDKNAAGIGLVRAFDEIKEALDTVSKHPLISRDFSFYVIPCISWTINFSVGLPMLAKHSFAGSIGDYGSLVAAYGFGGLFSSLLVGNRTLQRPGLLRALGNVIWGAGFIAVATAPNLIFALVGAGMAAFGSPMMNVTMMTIIQRDIPPDQIGKVSSLRTTIAGFGNVLGSIIAGAAYSCCSVATVMGISASAVLGVGLFELLRQYKTVKARHI